MKIAVLSWGSLVREFNQRGLEILDWQSGGPRLPVEYSRISQSGDRKDCLTLVIDESCGTFCETFFAISTNKNLNAAIKNLRLVEGAKHKQSVGYVNLAGDSSRGFSEDHHPFSCEVIKRWASNYEFDAVIWTSLLPNFEEITGTPFSIDKAKEYLDNLPSQTRAKAIDYIRGVPPQITTPLRLLLQRD